MVASATIGLSDKKDEGGVQTAQKGNKDMYYITSTAKRKNAKRHIVMKSTDYAYIKKMFDLYDNNRYIYEICNGKWEVLESK